MPAAVALIAVHASRLARRSLAVLVLAAASACASRTPPQVMPASPAAFDVNASPSQPAALIAEIKAFEGATGVAPTGNFLTSSPRLTSDERCYFTGKLQLPEFYSGLRMERESEARCEARAGESDVFFYPVQAVASGSEAITVSLAQAPVERLLVVVPHEDFHNQAETWKAPTEVAEAASTLLGLLTASAFAKEQYGPESPTFLAIDRDIELFLRKSLLVNQYYAKVHALYESFQSGMLDERQTMAEKRELFDELQRACTAISPEPVSFNKCPAAMNNAGLAFDQTYTRNYPLLYDLYTLLGNDTAALVARLKTLMVAWPAGAATATDLLHSRVGE
jgi:hypothetical protein